MRKPCARPTGCFNGEGEGEPRELWGWYCREYFDPDPTCDDESGIGDFEDDLHDTYKDVRGNLVLYDQGRVADATWQWAFDHRVHWGRHAAISFFAWHQQLNTTLSRPMHKFASAVMLWAVVAQPVFGSQTGCTFSTGDTPGYYEIEFIGYGDTMPVLVFSATTFGAGKRITLRPADYTLHHFSQKDRRVGLEFRNPQNPALPPSFTLAGTGDHVWLTIGAIRTRGDLKCSD